MGRPPKSANTESKVEQVKTVTETVVEKVDTEKEQLRAQLAEQQKKMEELMAQMSVMMQAQAGGVVDTKPKSVKRNIKFINMTASAFVIHGTRFYNLDKQFAYRTFPETEAKVIFNNMPKAITDGLLYIADHDFIDECGLEDVYTDLLTVDDLKNLFTTSVEDICEIYRNANDSQREIIIDMVSDKVMNGEPIDANILVRLGQLSGKDLIGMEKLED